MTWARALADAEVRMGSAWVWNPDRWGTADGYVDHRSLLAVWPALQRKAVTDRFSILRAVKMALGGEAAAALLREDERALQEARDG